MRRNIDIEALRALLENSNLPDRAIAERVKVSIATVHNYRQRWGMIVPGGSKYERDERIMAIIRDTNLSISQAAEQAGVSDTTIERIRKKHGIQSVFAQAFATAKATIIANTEAQRQRTEQQKAEEQRQKINAYNRRKNAEHKSREPLVFESASDELAHLIGERRRVEKLMTEAALSGHSADYQQYAKEYSALTYKIEFCESRLKNGNAHDYECEGGRAAYWNGHAKTFSEPTIY